MATDESGKPSATAATAGAAPAAPAPAQAHSDAGGQGRTSSAPKAAPTLNQVRFKCLMNAQYHAAREAFLDGVHRWMMFAVIVFGAAAVVDAFRDALWIKGVFGAGAAVLGALDLAFDLSNRARNHALLRRRYYELLGDVDEGRMSLVAADACLARLNGEEEPAYHALLNACSEAANIMVYGSAEGVHIPWWHRLLQNVWRFEGRIYAVTPVAVAASARSAPLSA